MLKGIDISYANGIVDFEKVKKYIDFVIIRAGYGKNNIDKQFKRNIAECNRLGIPCGVYWFSYALSVEDARKEAEYCLNAIKSYDVVYGVWFDLEYDSFTYAEKKGIKINANAHAKAFLEEVKKNGYLAGNYTNKDFANRIFNKEILAYPTWLAYYGKNNAQEPKSSLQNIVRHEMLQYTSKGQIDGIKGYVDMNISFVDYANKVNSAKNGWVEINGKWQYWRDNVQQKSVWVQSSDKTKWYYLKEDGWMAEKEWVDIQGKWYYLKEDGVMASNELLQIGTELFYFLADGRMATTNDRGALV